MRLSSRPLEGDPISSKTRRVAALLAREKTGEILARLRSHPYLAASELARLEDIHIATAQRYLQELLETDLVGVRPRRGVNRPTQEYWLREPRIRIDIDLQGTPIVGEDELLAVAKRLGVRDTGDPQVVYDTHPHTGIVQGILLLSEQPPRLVSRRIGVASSVGRFLARLPGRSEPPRPVWQVMQEAGLGMADLSAVLASLGRFAGPTTEPSQDNERAPEGSARLMDPELRRIFEELALGPDATADSPPVSVLELSLLTQPEREGADAPDGEDPRTDQPDPSDTPSQTHTITTTEAAQ